MCLSENNMSEAARNLDVDVDCALEKVCRVFGVSKHFPQQKKAIKAFISKERCLGKLANGVWQVAHIPDCFVGSR